MAPPDGTDLVPADTGDEIVSRQAIAAHRDAMRRVCPLGRSLTSMADHEAAIATRPQPAHAVVCSDTPLSASFG